MNDGQDEAIRKLVLASGFVKVSFFFPFSTETRIPARYLQNAASILIAALPYGTQCIDNDTDLCIKNNTRGSEFSLNGRPSPFDNPFAVTKDTRYPARIAPFARRNYYREAVKRLQAIIPKLRCLYGGNKSDYRIFCNSQIDEKKLALESGLGRAGKNTLVITEEVGSGFVLAGLTLPVALSCHSAGQDKDNLCVGCDACVRACPCGALGGGFKRERCIQWYASGYGETVPDFIREKWGETLYGCTLCQASCPYNKKDIAGVECDIGILPPALDSEKILAASDQTISNYFKGTAMGMKWLGPAAIRRNAACAASP